MRITEDGYSVAEYETVYEILSIYLNEEVSEAQPHINQVRYIPVQCKIWLKYDACLRECSIRNKPIVTNGDDERAIFKSSKTKNDNDEINT